MFKLPLTTMLTASSHETKKRTTAMERIIVENNKAWGRRTCVEPKWQLPTMILSLNHSMFKIHTSAVTPNSEGDKVLNSGAIILYLHVSSMILKVTRFWIQNDSCFIEYLLSPPYTHEPLALSPPSMYSLYTEYGKPSDQLPNMRANRHQTEAFRMKPQHDLSLVACHHQEKLVQKCVASLMVFQCIDSRMVFFMAQQLSCHIPQEHHPTGN